MKGQDYSSVIEFELDMTLSENYNCDTLNWEKWRRNRIMIEPHAWTPEETPCNQLYIFALTGNIT